MQIFHDNQNESSSSSLFFISSIDDLRIVKQLENNYNSPNIYQVFSKEK